MGYAAIPGEGQRPTGDWLTTTSVEELGPEGLIRLQSELAKAWGSNRALVGTVGELRAEVARLSDLLRETGWKDQG